MNDPIALLVVAHAPLANALRAVALHVYEQDVSICAVDILPGACAQDSTESLLARIQAIDEGAGVLIMTDLPGASPCNISVRAALKARQANIACQVIAGVNPAMVLRAINYRTQSLDALVEQAMQGARRAIQRVDAPAGQTPV